MVGKVFWRENLISDGCNSTESLFIGCFSTMSPEGWRRNEYDADEQTTGAASGSELWAQCSPVHIRSWSILGDCLQASYNVGILAKKPSVSHKCCIKANLALPLYIWLKPPCQENAEWGYIRSHLRSVSHHQSHIISPCSLIIKGLGSAARYKVPFSLRCMLCGLF